jgi:hypothetical protein
MIEFYNIHRVTFIHLAVLVRFRQRRLREILEIYLGNKTWADLSASVIRQEREDWFEGAFLLGGHCRMLFEEILGDDNGRGSTNEGRSSSSSGNPKPCDGCAFPVSGPRVGEASNVGGTGSVLVAWGNISATVQPQPQLVFILCDIDTL